MKEIADPGTVQPKRLASQTTAAADVDPDNDVPEHDCRGLGWSNAELRALVEFIMLHGQESRGQRITECVCGKLQQVSLRLGLLPPPRDLVNYSVVTFCT